MNRTRTTEFLSRLVIHHITEKSAYYADEVTIDYGHGAGSEFRVDFLQFTPENQMSVSGIEHGRFTVYEVKSCIEDCFSGHGLNFIGDRNYIVTTMECWKKLSQKMNDGSFLSHYTLMHPRDTRAYHNLGIMVAVPRGRKAVEEFEEMTPLDGQNPNDWKLETIISGGYCYRERSATELLFLMLRAGQKFYDIWRKE